MTTIINATSVNAHPFNYDLYNERVRNANGNLVIAFLSDTHIGYSAHRHSNRQSINLREIDGERALFECIRGIIDDPQVSTVIHGGDFFHSAHPNVRQIKVVMNSLEALAKAGIKVFGQAGNHDVSDDNSELTAVALLDNPSRYSHALWTPYQVYEIFDGVFLHSVSHHGLRGDEAPAITPITDGLNLFSTHGSAFDPSNHTLMHCADSLREQLIPAEMIIDDSFIAKLLGHYHNRYSIAQGQFNAWYAGSTVRRGFSDEPGGRGWMRFTITPNGEIDVENRNIFQRPQYDLPIIDASGLNATELVDMIQSHIDDTGMDLSVFDELNAPIVRQKVINANKSLRGSIDRRRLNKMTENMLDWNFDPSSPAPVKRTVVQEDGSEEIIEEEVSANGTPSLTQERGIGGAVQFFDNWVSNSSTLSNIPEGHRVEVTTQARSYLTTAETAKGK